jgi:uncharacterized protein (TIGR02271 family)
MRNQANGCLRALERKPVTEPTPTDEKPVETRTEIKIPVKRDEIESTKQSYVKGEVIAMKKPVRETQVRGKK